MRKYLITSLIVGLLVASPIFNASAALKSGASCSKAGSTSTIAGKKFTCAKSGQKLVWRLLDKPNSILIPAKKNDTNVEANEIANALTKELPSVDLSHISEAAIGKVVAEPGISQENIDGTLIILRQLYAAQPIMKLVKQPVVILGYSEAFLKSEFSKYCNENLDWIGQGQITMERWENWASAGCLKTTPTQIVPMPPTGTALKHIEGAIGSDLGYVAIGHGESTKFLPGWFVRGLKGVVGEYMASMGKRIWKVDNAGASSCLKYRLSQVSDSYENIANWCQTSLGQNVARYMVAKKGLASTLDFSNMLHAKGGWTESDFATFMGVSFEAFEASAKNYISSLSDNS